MVFATYQTQVKEAITIAHTIWAVNRKVHLTCFEQLMGTKLQFAISSELNVVNRPAGEKRGKGLRKTGTLVWRLKKY